LDSAEAVRSFLSNNSHGCMVCFSAHWCGPCKASKPALEQLAAQQTSDKMAIAYESDLGDALHQTYAVRAFPTYILFVHGQEQQRVEGANLAKVEEMLKQIPSVPLTGGETLGGTGAAALSPAEARAARLAKLGASADAADAQVAAATAMETDEAPKEAEAAQKTTEASAPSPAKTDPDGDTEMKEASSANASAADIAATLDPASLQTLTEDMGFSLLRAQKGLIYGTGGTVEGAVEWLTLHQDDDDIDTAPITQENIGAQSYKCNDCGKILSNMANLELHANKTGHSDFEESTERVKPLTEEEKQAKIAEIKVCERLCVWWMDVCDTVSHLIASFFLLYFLPSFDTYQFCSNC